MAGGFTLNTRRKIVRLPDLTRPTGGGTVSINLPKTGLLARLWLAIRGEVTGSLSAPNTLGMASIVERVRVTANSGIDLVNISGQGYHYGIREMLESGYVDVGSASNARDAVTATVFNLDMMLPIALNLRDPMGLIMLQNEQTVITLSIDFRADANVATGGTVVATVSPYMEIFTVPVDPADYPPLNIVHSLLEDNQVVSGAGDFVYNWPRGNTYLQVWHGLGIGASGSDGFDNFAIRINQADYLQQTPVQYLDMEHRGLRGRARPAGGVYVDLLGTSGLGTYGLTRDLFNSALVTDLASVLAATGAGTLFTVRRQFIVLQ